MLYSKRYLFRRIPAHNMSARLHQQLCSSSFFHTTTHNHDRRKRMPANKVNALVLIESLRTLKLPMKEHMKLVSLARLVNSDTSYEFTSLLIFLFLCLCFWTASNTHFLWYFVSFLCNLCLKNKKWSFGTNSLEIYAPFFAMPSNTPGKRFRRGISMGFRVSVHYLSFKFVHSVEHSWDTL